MRGSPRAERRKNEPKPADGVPRCPPWLTPEAKKHWRRLIPLLASMNILKITDAEAIARYCHLWHRWRKAEEFLGANGECYPLRDEAGKVKCLMPYPQVAIANRLASQLLRLEQEFGLTPSARTRIYTNAAIENPVVPDAKDRFFAAG